MTERPVYESENITMCTDGKYRWVYELNLYKNPAIIKEVGRVMFISLVIVLALIFGFQMIDGIGTFAEKLQFVAELAGILVAILLQQSPGKAHQESGTDQRNYRDCRFSRRQARGDRYRHAGIGAFFYVHQFR